ncbi:MAG: excisionase family DNA-binding protein [Planctomycetota bacterium]
MPPMKIPTRHLAPEFASTLSLSTAARRLGISQRELRRRLGRGGLPFVQVRGQIRVPKKALGVED